MDTNDNAPDEPRKTIPPESGPAISKKAEASSRSSPDLNGPSGDQPPTKDEILLENSHDMREALSGTKLPGTNTRSTPVSDATVSGTPVAGTEKSDAATAESPTKRPAEGPGDFPPKGRVLVFYPPKPRGKKTPNPPEAQSESRDGNKGEEPRSPERTSFPEDPEFFLEARALDEDRTKGLRGPSQAGKSRGKTRFSLVPPPIRDLSLPRKPKADPSDGNTVPKPSLSLVPSPERQLLDHIGKARETLTKDPR
jgi:hypothetical protein